MTRPIATFNQHSLQELIDGGVREQKTLDVKEFLSLDKEYVSAALKGPRKPKNALLEFLADVCQFANSEGGVLVFGMSEVEGVITGFVPQQDSPDLDRFQGQIHSYISSGIDPPLRAETHALSVTLQNQLSSWCIVLRVGPSLQAPHRVIDSGHYYIRRSRGKEIMDATELRDEFLRSEGLISSLLKLRLDRLSKIKANETPVQLASERRRNVLHLIPITAAKSRDQLTFDELHRRPGPPTDHLFSAFNSPLMGSFRTERFFNFEGYCADFPFPLSRKPEHLSIGYIQWFRNGVVELVDCSSGLNGEDEKEPGLIMDGELESIFFDTHYSASTYTYKVDGVDVSRAGRILSAATVTGLESHWFFCLSLLGYKGCYFQSRADAVGRKIRQDDLVLPEVYLERPYCCPETLRATFDRVMNAGGIAKSRCFDANGIWITK